MHSAWDFFIAFSTAVIALSSSDIYIVQERFKIIQRCIILPAVREAKSLVLALLIFIALSGLSKLNPTKEIIFKN